MQLFVTLLALAALSAAPRTQTFIGIISDNVCGAAGHTGMQMGPTDAECTTACIATHGALYVLVVGKKEYTFSDQKAPAQFAGQKVKVVGTLDAKRKTIRIDSITTAR